MKKARRGMSELLIEPPEKAVRKADPPRRTAWKPYGSGNAKQDVLAAIEKLCGRMDDMLASIPQPPTIPKPPGPPPPPPPRTLTWDDRCGWHIPCSLTAEQLALGMPSEQTLRFMRAARDKYEAEAKQRGPHQ
jgi:hypothetical protein